MQAFSEFINGTTATPNQIEFINLVVQELTQTGVMEPGRLFESPFTDVNAQGPLGIFAPAKTPPAIIDRLNQEITKALSAPDVRQQLVEKNFDVIKSSPQEFTKIIEKDLALYGRLIKESNIKPD